jgi:hypothetical protein
VFPSTLGCSLSFTMSLSRSSTCHPWGTKGEDGGYSLRSQKGSKVEVGLSWLGSHLNKNWFKLDWGIFCQQSTTQNHRMPFRQGLP